MNNTTTPAPAAARKTPLPLRRGPIVRPQKAVLYGPEGVGKTTLASQLPDPVFLDIESGTHHLDVVRFEGIHSWDSITGAVAALAAGGHEFKTLVLDTVDWAEKRLAEHLCAKANKDSIEDFGYGKGYVLLAEEFAKFLASLDVLLARGMHVVFLAHSTVKKFESPDQAGSYDRYELKLTKQVAPLVREWADAILFVNFITRLAEKDNGRMRGVGGKERALFTTHTAAYDAKNRHGLPDKLAFEAAALAPVFGPQASASASTTAPASDTQNAAASSPKPGIKERIESAFDGELALVTDFLVHRGLLSYTTEGTIEDLDALDAEYAARMLAEPKRFLEAVHVWADEIPGLQTAEKEAATTR
jgi:hypothetical protein